MAELRLTTRGAAYSGDHDLRADHGCGRRRAVHRAPANHRAPGAAAALVNPAIRIRSVATLVPTPEPYPWTPAASAAADRLDFVTRAADLTTQFLIISGADDHPILRTDAADLAAAIPHAQLATIPNLAHALAEEPGIHPAPQLPQAKAVDKALTEWFLAHLPTGTQN